MKTKTPKINILISVMLVACALCTLAAACAPNPATYIKLNEEKIALYVGESVTLTAETDGAEVLWNSDAVHIATVDGGRITAVAAGEATVKARSGKVRAYCEVIVVEEGQVKPFENLCDKYGGYFVIGAAVQTGKLTGGSYGDLMLNFNSITPENNMKWKNVERSKGEVNFDQPGDSADKLIEWAEQNGTGVRGHCLIWYKSLPEWLHNEFYGKAFSEESKNRAYSYLDEHIQSTMRHFGNGVYVWDVGNELLSNWVTESDLKVTGSYPYGNIWRTEDNMTDDKSDWVDWYKVCGGYEYIARSFKKADEVRREDGLNVELYYNDYGLNNPSKRQACINLIKMLRDNDAPVDGVGMQAHYRLESYLENKTEWIQNFEASVKAFTDAGVDVQITELDIRFDGALTQEKEEEQAEMYGRIFEVCRRYAKSGGAEHGVTGVTFWGVQDGSNGAWGSEQRPLVFGRDKLPKKAYYEIMNF